MRVDNIEVNKTDPNITSKGSFLGSSKNFDLEKYLHYEEEGQSIKRTNPYKAIDLKNLD